MNRACHPYPFLAMVTVCIAIAGVFIGQVGPLRTPMVAGAPQSQSCVEDVSITVDGVWEGLTYTLADPPDYADGDDIWIAYTVTNSSCGDVTVTVALTGSVSKATIHDANGSLAPCANGCAISAGSLEYGTVQWDLGKHPNATGEKVIATVTIDAPSDFTDTNAGNNSATSTESINIVNEETTDVAVKSVAASKTSALIGDEIQFTVTISNEGDAEADVMVTLDRGDGTVALASETVSDLAAEDESTVKLSWDTDGTEAGGHNLRVLVATEGDGNSANDSKSVTVTLREPSTDVAVTGIQPASTEAVIGETVNFAVSLQNHGDVAVAPTVSLYKGDDTTALASATAERIAVGATGTITVGWDTTDAEAGAYHLRVVAAVTDDDDPTNNSATASLNLYDPVDVQLTFTSPVASHSVRGSSVNVAFTVSNTGKNDTDGILISLSVAASGKTVDTAQPAGEYSLPTLAVDDTYSGTLTWDTDDVAVGNYDIWLMATTPGDTDPSNNSISASMEIRNWLSLRSVSPSTAVAIVGEAVEFTARVENVGQQELTDLTVALFESHVTEPLGSTTISTLSAGATTDATIQWNTAGRSVEVVDVSVAVGQADQVADKDDQRWVSVELRNPITLSSVNVTSTDNVSGSIATINAQVLNESNAQVTDVVVTLYLEDSEKELDSASIESIAAGESAEVALAWDTGGVQPGDHQLKVMASSPGYGVDSNDSRPLAVTLRAPVQAIELAGATINRNVAAVGQTLEVVATIANHGEAPASVPVGLYLIGALQQTTAVATSTSSPIEPGASSTVALQWDSTGEEHAALTLRVTAELPEDTTPDDNEKFLEIELFQSAFDGMEDGATCVEDIRIGVTDIRDLSDERRSPPDYSVGETLRAAYSVYNFSCQTDATLSVTMTGPEGYTIADPTALCLSDCVVPFGGRAEGEIAWTIPTLPALNDQPIKARVTVVAPTDFADVDEANNTGASTDRVNIVHPGDLEVHLGEQPDRMVGMDKSLAYPEFGSVDVRLVSVTPPSSAVPFAAESAQIVVEAANDGPQPEPTVLQFFLTPDDSTGPLKLHQYTVVIPAGESRIENVALPMAAIPPGTHIIAVVLSAAIDQSQENDVATFEITRVGPLIQVEMSDVRITPDVPMLGDHVAVSVKIQNESEVAVSLALQAYLDAASEPAATQTLAELPPGAQSAGQLRWRVPATAKMLGPHTLQLAAFSETFGRVATIGTEITFHIDAEIVGIEASPGDTAMQGEEVAINVEVKNNGPAMVHVPVTLDFPSENKQSETLSPPVGPGATKIAQFAWKTRNYAIGDHLLTATLPQQHNLTGGDTSADIPFQLSPLTITASIVDISRHPITPSVGEPVSITVRVRNDGPIAVRIPVTLHFPAANKQPVTRHPLIEPGETGTATFEWLTGHYPAGSHRFQVQLAAVGEPYQFFTIDLLPAIENVAIVAMGTYPADTAMVGEPVEVWVDVRNDGPTALNVPVRLTFPSAARQPKTWSPRVGPGETATVFFEWKTSNYEPGIHILRASILLDNNVTIGQTSREIRLELTPLVITASILDVVVAPAIPRVGEPVTISVTLRNDGRLAANIPVILHFPSADKQPEIRSPRVPPGETTSVSFQWRTSRYKPGDHTFYIEVPSTPPLLHEFTIELFPPLVDVAIVGIGSDPAATAVQGQAVKIWVDVMNNGPLTLNVPVQLSFSSDDRESERRSPRVEPGETVRVEFTWKTANYDIGDHLLTATLLVDYNITELDTSASIRITLVPAQLLASIVDISWSPDDPVAGEPVTIRVTVRNDGRLAANIPVTLHFPSADKQPEIRSPRVPPGETTSVSFQWRTGRYEPGDHTFRLEIVGIAGAVSYFVIELLPPAVDFAVVDVLAPDPLHPTVKGDWISLTAVVKNSGPYTGRGTVYLSNESDQDAMYERTATLEAGEIKDVEFTWKTLRYPVGEYELLVRVDAEYDTDPDNDHSDLVPVSILTNRDITVGFGEDRPPEMFAGQTIESGLKSAAEYPREIHLISYQKVAADGLIDPPSASLLGVVPKPLNGRHDPARLYWRWRSAQLSQWECARYQRAVGAINPRAVMCPGAPPVVR